MCVCVCVLCFTFCYKYVLAYIHKYIPLNGPKNKYMKEGRNYTISSIWKYLVDFDKSMKIRDGK